MQGVRCFVAIELPDPVRRRLGDLQERLARQCRGVRWVRPDAIHVTLKFLGDVPDAQLAPVSEAVSDVASQCMPFEFEVRSAGCFPPQRSARVVWAGVENTTEALATCQDLCENAFVELGFARESRSFSPHLTLGRVKDPRSAGDLRKRVAELGDFDGGTVIVSELILFESRLSKQGAQYVPVHRAALAS